MKTITLIIALFSLTNLFAINNNNEEAKPKSFSISGKVIDNNENLTGVKIELDGKQMIVYTDFDGNFTLENILPGDHTISLSLITYNNKEITFNPEKNNNLEIELETK